ncbi:hypothetical protein ACHAWO_005493 [Cyclotella atomus]|uniref:Uncharacterized protein n=1 Tax=Cyclotella atomus TaxID=382360 RepID=A0ABD3QAA1_9STRA
MNTHANAFNQASTSINTSTGPNSQPPTTSQPSAQLIMNITQNKSINNNNKTIHVGTVETQACIVIDCNNGNIHIGKAEAHAHVVFNGNNRNVHTGTVEASWLRHRHQAHFVINGNNGNINIHIVPSSRSNESFETADEADY